MILEMIQELEAGMVSLEHASECILYELQPAYDSDKQADIEDILRQVKGKELSPEQAVKMIVNLR